MDEKTMFSEEMTAAEAISVNITEYGHHTLRTKIAHLVDGLKPIHRYILWTIAESEKPTKVASVTGVVMDKYHPVGDAAISEAIVRLTQSFVNTIPLVYSDSNIGSYAGDEAAKARYLPVKSHPFTRDVYFKGIESKTFNFIPSETGEGVVPEYLIPKIPMGLLTGFSGIGIGYSSTPVRLSLECVCSMVKTYAELQKQYCRIIPRNVLIDTLSSYLIPDFSVSMYLRNRNQLLKAYSQNCDYSKTLYIDGTMEITPTMLIIKTLPPDVSPMRMYQKLGELRSNKDPFVDGYFQEILDASIGRHEACIECTLKRGVNPFDVLDQFKKLIQFTKPWSPNTLMIDNHGMCAEVTPIEILEQWYIERSRSIMAEIKITQHSLIKQIRRLRAQLIIVDDMDRVVDLFKSAPSPQATIEPLCQWFKLTEYQAKFLSKLSLGQLTGTGKDELIAALKDVEDKLSQLRDRYQNIDALIAEDAETIGKTYSDIAVRKCISPTFMGVVKIGNNGYIQYIDLHELAQIVNRFINSTMEISIYPNGPKNKYVERGQQVVTEDDIQHPKEFVCDRYVVSRLKPKFTLYYANGTLSRLKDYVVSSDNNITCPVGDIFTNVDKSGVVSLVSSSTIPLRPTLQSPGVKFDSIYMSPVAYNEVIVVYANTHKVASNMITISRVATDGSEKLATLPMGQTVVIGVFRPDEDIQFSIPDSIMTRCKVQHFHIDGKIISGHVKVDVAKKSTNDDVSVEKLFKGIPLYTLKLRK